MMMQRTIVLLLALFGSALLLNVPITVKETARTGTNGFPVTFVLPLPFGALVDTQKLRVVDANGSAVPAQFEVLNRYWTATPQYLRHVTIHFQPSVPAWTGTTTSGIQKYYVRDDLTGQALHPAVPVTVQDASNATTVVTGPLKFVLRKTAFTVINELWFDANGNGVFEDKEKVISHDTKNGGVLVERDGTSTQYDAQRSDLTWEVEETGPLRAVIRVDYPTLYNATDIGLLKRGAAVRLYAYAGKPFVYLDYQIQNSAKVPLSWYLYFKEMNVEFTLTNFKTSRVRVGMADKSVYEKTGSYPNVRLFQSGLLKGDLYDGESIVKSVNNQSNFVWLSLQDTSSNVAVTSTIRHFWERWPNALQASGNKVSLQLFPKGSATWTSIFTPWGLNPSGYYYVADMAHIYKESFLYFHNANESSESVTNVIKLFHNPPVAILPTGWYAQSKATLDLGGTVPIETPSNPTNIRMKKETPSLEFHTMSTFGDPEGLYRAGSCAHGGIPRSSSMVIASEDPADFFIARNYLIGELNLRTQWLAHWDYSKDFSSVHLSENGYCEGNWRQFLGSADKFPVVTAPLFNGTQRVFQARDDEHAWFYHAEEAYYLTGNLWYKDWIKFIAQFRQVRLNQKDPVPDMSQRGMGHSLNHALSAFKATGDMRIINQMAVYLRKYVAPTTNPYYGDSTTAGFQTGYLMRWNANYWQELFYGAPTNATYAQNAAEALNHLYAMTDWNYNYGQFPYYRDRGQYPNSTSSYTSHTIVDAEMFVYLITGHQWFINHTISYVRAGLNGGDRPDGEWRTWTGQWYNRVFLRVKNHTRDDKQPPSKVTDLVAYRKAGDTRVIFRWTPVATAIRYHAVYCDRPIVFKSSFNQSVCNWWAASAVGVPFGNGPFYRNGNYQYFYFDSNATSPTYIALFSFDDASNMSPMSSVVQPSSTNVLTLPAASYSSAPISITLPGSAASDAVDGTSADTGPVSESSQEEAVSGAVGHVASLMSVSMLVAFVFF